MTNKKETIPTNTKNVLCSSCGNKLYDAEKNLGYTSMCQTQNDGKHYQRCIYCWNMVPMAEVEANWPKAAWQDTPRDFTVWDEQAHKHGIVPPTVHKRYYTEIDRLIAPGGPPLSIEKAEGLLNRVWTEWLLEEGLITNKMSTATKETL